MKEWNDFLDCDSTGKKKKCRNGSNGSDTLNDMDETMNYKDLLVNL